MVKGFFIVYDDLSEKTFKNKWIEMRKALDEETIHSIDEIFEKSGEGPGLEKEEAIICFEKSWRY